MVIVFRQMLRLSLAASLTMGYLLINSLVFADILQGNTTSNPFKATAYSNGCGGAGFSSLVPDSFRIENPTSKQVIIVTVTRACDMHDAGYSGGIVYDSIRTGTVDFRMMSRLGVDQRFENDLFQLCKEQTSGVLQTLCNGKAHIYFSAVRKYGTPNFDADPTTQGIQANGPRSNN